MKIAIISYTSRQEGCFCGVEKFNWYLQKAIGGEIFTATMFKVQSPRALNEILWNTKRIDEQTLCIVDGAWGLGIPIPTPVLSVVHGTWAEFSLRNTGQLLIDADQQNAWHRQGIKTVAVSQASAKYLEKHHGVKADKVILNGTDTNLFSPLNKINSIPIVIHGARDYNKTGRGKLDKIAELLSGRFVFKYIDSPAGTEHVAIKMGDLFLQCSNYEGNSYASLEAMACGLPVIASCAGLYEDTDFGNLNVGKTVPWDAPADVYANAIENVWANKNDYNPRQWVLENATYELFAKQWQTFIGENYGK